MTTARLSDAARLLRELIAIPSVNPAFLPPGDPHAGEREVATYLSELAKKAGLEVRHQKILGERANLLVILKPSGKAKQRILLAPHLDTVGGDLDSIFKPRLETGRMHGRGACDTKGSVAAMFSALRETAKSSNRPRQTEIVFAGLIDEEDKQSGSRALAKSGFRADLAIVGEPTQLETISAHKGDIWARLSIQGKSAHGAKPHLGINAVHKMTRVVEILLTEYADSLKQKTHPLLGQATINVGSIRGGTQANIVPDECFIEIDRRTLPGEQDAKVLREIDQLLRKRGFRCRFDDLKGVPCPPMEVDADHALIRSIQKSAGKRTTRGVDFFCDAAILARAGIPAIVFGPGNIAQAHTADEWISLKSLDRGTAILSGFLQSLP